MTPQTLLYLELTLALSLLAGAGLARATQYKLHGWVQSLVVVTNLVLIVTIMHPSLHYYSSSSGQGNEKWIVYGHATLGAIAELAGLYIVLSAGLGWFKLPNYKVAMRTTLVLWLCVFGMGAWTYQKLNGASSAPPPLASSPTRITVKNFSFEPQDLTISAGTEVEWFDDGGRHTVSADDGSFKSETLTADNTFKHKFEKPGKYLYYCDFHGSAGGHAMSGSVTVK